MIGPGGLWEPRAGGELRTHHLARGLSRLGHRVDVMGLVARNHPTGRRRIDGQLSITQTHSLWLDLASLADRAGVVPITTLPQWLRLMRGRVRRWTAARPYDVVEFDYPWFAYLYGAVGGKARVVYGAHNIESEYWRSRLARHPLGGWFARGLRRHELTAATRADGVVVCSEHDQRWFQDEAPEARPPVVVPNGYDAESIEQPSPATREQARRLLGLGADERVALFIGHDTPPNREAVKAILEHVVPRHGPSRPMRTVIVGRVCSAFKGQRVEGVRWEGRVHDVRPYLYAADVGLNPIQSGSGSNIKLAEYCAARLPAVTTEFGLRGFEALRPWVHVAETAQFAEAISRTAWPNPIPQSALDPFSWGALAAKLSAFYQSLLEEG